MLSLLACRRSLLLAHRSRPFLFLASYTTHSSSTSPTPPDPISYDYDDYSDSRDQLIDDLDDQSAPPTAGEDGFARQFTGSKTNPVVDRLILPKYRLHCHSTRNNTITTFTEPNGNTIAWFSGGSCGFKRGQRASYEAGYQCSVRIFKAIEQVTVTRGISLELFFKGFGQGREAMQKALMTTEGQAVRPLISSVTDRTPIKIGGTRAKKMRRL